MPSDRLRRPFSSRSALMEMVEGKPLEEAEEIDWKDIVQIPRRFAKTEAQLCMFSQEDYTA